MHDVIVVDEEFEDSHRAVRSACSRIERLLSVYCTLMNFAASRGAISGATSDALKSYIGYAERLKGVASELADHHGEVKNLFLSAIDAADQYLY